MSIGLCSLLSPCFLGGAAPGFHVDEYVASTFLNKVVLGESRPESAYSVSVWSLCVALLFGQGISVHARAHVIEASMIV